MDANFLDINPKETIQIQKNDQIFLFKLPKNVNITDLDKVKIDLHENAITNIELQNRRKLKVIVTNSIGYHRFRPIIQSSHSSTSTAAAAAAGAAVVGKPFTKIINITDYHEETSTENTINLDGLDDILKDQAYPKPKQHSELRVQSVPIGSLSTKKDIENRSRRLEDLNKSVKRQRVAFKPVESSSSSSKIIDIKDEEETLPRKEKKEKDEKKKKKEKKEKKHKKDL